MGCAADSFFHALFCSRSTYKNLSVPKFRHLMISSYIHKSASFLVVMTSPVLYNETSSTLNIKQVHSEK